MLVSVGAVLAGCGQGTNTQPVSPPAASTSDQAPSVKSTSIPMVIRIPTLGVSQSFMSPGPGKNTCCGLNPDLTVEVPDVKHPELVGWYRASAVPGNTGPAVILGHINGGGKSGVFAQLSTLEPGAKVYIDRSDGQTATFTISKVDIPAKKNFPTQEVYGNTPDSEIRLISCGGRLDRVHHDYLDQVIAYGRLESLKPTGTQ